MSDRFAPIDPTPWLPPLEAHFGIPGAAFDGYYLIQSNRKYVSIVPLGHTPPRVPEPEFVGLPFLRIGRAVPKLTTAAAQRFGRHATRNVIAATRAQLDAFLTRQPFTPTTEQTPACTGGYVLVQHRQLTWGVGFYRPEQNEVESQFPKVLARGLIAAEKE